jgi:hypothetical protein
VATRGAAGDSVGNSQTSGRWVAGSTNRTYNIYSSYFVLSASQTVGGTRLADGTVGNGTGYTGDTAASLFSNSWQAGDRIIGMGIQYTGSTRGTQFFFHTDTGGNNILPASSFGAGDGVLTFDAGDTSSYIVNTSNVPGSRGRVHQYSIWTGFSPNGSPQNGNYITPYGLVPSLAMPVRSFSVLDAGSGVSKQEPAVVHEHRCGVARERRAHLWRRRLQRVDALRVHGAGQQRPFPADTS